MQQAGVVHRAGQRAERAFQNLARFSGAGVGRGFAGALVPHPPRCAVHDRLDEDVPYVEVVGMRLMDAAHGIGEGIVPGRLVLDHVALRIARGQCLDQRAFRRGDVGCKCERHVGGIVGTAERCGLAARIHQFPRKIVVRARGIADAPMCHGTVGIGGQRLLEAADRLFMVKSKAPVEATIEPALRVRRSGGHCPRIWADVIRIVHCRLPPVGCLIMSGCRMALQPTVTIRGSCGNGSIERHAIAQHGEHADAEHEQDECDKAREESAIPCPFHSEPRTMRRKCVTRTARTRPNGKRRVV